MNRRDALAALTLAPTQIPTALAALPAAPPKTAAGPAPAAGKNRLWKTAVGLNGFESGSRKYKKTYPLWEVLDFASRNRFDGVELVMNWPMGPYPRATETDRVRALARLYDAYGLQIFSIQVIAADAFAPDATLRVQWVEDFKDRVALARQLGCACIGLWPAGGLRGGSVEEGIAHLGTTFGQAAEIAARAGIVTAFEIEPPFVFNTEDHLVRIHQAARHPNLKIIYDPSHFDLMNGSTGRPHEMLKRVGVKNIGYVQLADGDGTKRDGGTSKHLGVGDGHAHIDESLALLRQGGFRGWIMMDTWEVPDPYDACLKGKRAIDAAAR